MATAVCQYISNIYFLQGNSIYLQKSHTSIFELLMSNQFYHGQSGKNPLETSVKKLYHKIDHTD